MEIRIQLGTLNFAPNQRIYADEKNLFKMKLNKAKSSINGCMLIS